MEKPAPANHNSDGCPRAARSAPVREKTVCATLFSRVKRADPNPDGLAGRHRYRPNTAILSRLSLQGLFLRAETAARPFGPTTTRFRNSGFASRRADEATRPVALPREY